MEKYDFDHGMIVHHVSAIAGGDIVSEWDEYHQFTPEEQAQHDAEMARVSNDDIMNALMELASLIGG